MYSSSFGYLQPSASASISSLSSSSPLNPVFHFLYKLKEYVSIHLEAEFCVYCLVESDEWMIDERCGRERSRLKEIMRTLCDSCESAEAIVFCAADEAALCRSCDEKIHLCNKLANRHVRVGLVDPCVVPHCDICEKAPAFFYCEVDGSSLCMQCDMTVHVGGKRTHGRFLLIRQRVEFPVDKPGRLDELGLKPPDDPHESVRHPNQPPRPPVVQNHQSHRISPIVDGKLEHERFDLNTRPQQMTGQSSNNQSTDAIGLAFHESAGMAPVGSFLREPEK